ncbi:MAG: 2-dehydropantoate 2-reductase [Pseudomonadota bacterium]
MARKRQHNVVSPKRQRKVVAPKPVRIAVAGAGSIGCFVGGLLALAGHDVRFLGRARIIAAARDGLRLTGFDGLDAVLEAPHMSEDPAEVLTGADLVLVCVKTADTADIATHVAVHAPKARVISLQNGVGNAEALRAALPGADVRAAMVPFNVVARGPAHFHRGTSGDIVVEAGPLPALDTPHLAWRQSDRIEAVQWGKLLINLGNAVNALADIPLRDQLRDRAWRRIMAAQMAEALRVLRAAGIRPARSTAAAPWLIPHILRLPDALFVRIAAQMLTIDAEARSSMWEDLTLRRPTEIDALQGVIVALAAEHGMQAPINARLHGLIKAAEGAGEGPPGLRPSEVWG